MTGGGRRSNTGRIFEAARHEAWGSPVDNENWAQLFQKPWDSPVSRLWLSLGTVPVFEIFEAVRNRDRGAKCLPGIAERQLGILNRSAFPDSELALGGPRAPARPIAIGNFRGSGFAVYSSRRGIVIGPYGITAMSMVSPCAALARSTAAWRSVTGVIMHRSISGVGKVE